MAFFVAKWRAEAEVCFGRLDMKKEQRIEFGKKIFYENYGNYFSIAMNYGDRKYKKFRIPKELEKDWQDDIKREYFKRIYATKGAEQHKNVLIYIDLLTAEQAVEFLEDLLNQPLDSFTRLLYCENIKNHLRFVKSSLAASHARFVIAKNKEQLLSQTITVDPQYKYEMQPYNYNWNELPQRIQNL